ncbi:MAG: aminopeptidase P N-terminal domain-containing protein [Halothiobacillaceae bacterium]
MKAHQRRRKRLLKQLGPSSAAILPAASEQVRNRDNLHPFRQSSDFIYLTGLHEPDAFLVLVPGRQAGASLLFLRPRDPEVERWDGPMVGLEGAVSDYGADEAFAVGRLDELMPELLEGVHTLWLPFESEGLMVRAQQWFSVLRCRSRAGVVPPRCLRDLSALIHEQRLIKSAAEIRALRRAAEVSAEAHRAAMLAVKPGRYEYEIEAELLRRMRASNGQPSFLPIVAGGANACVLHYRANDCRLRDGELVLIDAGAELGDAYAGDITRTVPVNGRFTPAQRAVYEVVLAAQQAAIDASVPGACFDAPHQAAVTVITEGLVELGLLSGKPRKLIEKGAYKRFFMHRTGHWLGLDVHDVGDYKIDGQWRPLQPGMVTTVEPGLYLGHDRDIPKKYRNIGIRIEDDVLVTAEGPEVLTGGVPKTVAGIEALMAGE